MAAGSGILVDDEDPAARRSSIGDLCGPTNPTASCSNSATIRARTTPFILFDNTASMDGEEEPSEQVEEKVRATWNSRNRSGTSCWLCGTRDGNDEIRGYETSYLGEDNDKYQTTRSSIAA